MQNRICKVLEQHDGRIKFNTLLGTLADVNPMEIELALDVLNSKGIITANKGIISLVDNHNPAPVVEPAPVESKADAPAPEDNDLIHNGKPLSLVTKDDTLRLKLYGGELYGYNDNLIIESKEGLIKWLDKLYNDNAKAVVVADKLFDKFHINEELLNKKAELNKGMQEVADDMNPTLTSKLISVLRNYGFCKSRSTQEVYRYDYDKGYYILCDGNELAEFISDNISKVTDKSLSPELYSKVYKGLMHMKDIHHNILCFTNGYYNTDTQEFTLGQYTEGIPYYGFDFAYNPDAKPDKYFNMYWNNYSDELQGQLLELISCLLMKGNPYKKLFMLVGQGDIGKTVFINILNGLLKFTSDLDLASISKNGHELSVLLHSNVNFSSDEENLTIGSNSMIKKITGNDNILVNPKNKEPVKLAGNDMPKLVVVANNMPKFKNNERALINRLGIIIMSLNEPISKSEQVRHLDEKILAETSSMEWLLFQALEKMRTLTEDYKPSWDMSFKTDEEVYDIIGKHSDPVKYFLDKGFEYVGESSNFNVDYDTMVCNSHDNNLDDYMNYYISKSDMQTYFKKACALEKVQINNLDNKSEVKNKVIEGNINYLFGVNNYNYKSKRNGKSVERVYYFLKPKDYYYKVMEQ